MNVIAWRDSWRAALVALALAVTAGCGGGGGGDSSGSLGANSPPPSSPLPTPGVGSATISWDAPTLNTDGTALLDLSGFEIRYGKSSGTLDQSVTISGTGTTTYVIDNLSSGTWYFSVVARNSQGVTSNPSEIASKVIS
jgi:hypothetical protein